MKPRKSKSASKAVSSAVESLKQVEDALFAVRDHAESVERSTMDLCSVHASLCCLIGEIRSGLLAAFNVLPDEHPADKHLAKACKACDDLQAFSDFQLHSSNFDRPDRGYRRMYGHIVMFYALTVGREFEQGAGKLGYEAGLGFLTLEASAEEEKMVLDVRRLPHDNRERLLDLVAAMLDRQARQK